MALPDFTKRGPFLKADQIQKLIADLGAKISHDYASLVSDGSELIVVVTLKGAVFFAADLARHLKIPVRWDFVRLASYGAGTKSSGTVRLLKDIEADPQNHHVLILDEIADSGRTLQFLINRLKVASPKSVKVCALLSKPSRREVQIPVDYLGLEIEDKFVIGYGLDYAEHYRNFKDIYALEPGDLP